MIEDLVDRYPVISVEDLLDKNDWEGWKIFTERLDDKVQAAGDNLLVVNTSYPEEGIGMGVVNSILIKLNQVGTLTETFEAIKMAREAGYAAVVSYRSGETEDTAIADLAVATNAGQTETDSMSRTDRVTKYNQLMRIEGTLDSAVQYKGAHSFYNLHK